MNPITAISDRRLPRHWRGIRRNRPSLSPPDPVSIAVMGFGIVLAAALPLRFLGRSPDDPLGFRRRTFGLNGRPSALVDCAASWIERSSSTVAHMQAGPHITLYHRQRPSVRRR